MQTLQLIHNDCLTALQGMDDCSVDSIVTDPPYGLSFMGKGWDYDVPSKEIWAECLRVLKPGGHLLAFAGTRTQHRMCVNIEDAGFEIRDMIAWVYGSGFPKSMDISKAIDKAAGVEHLRQFKSKNPADRPYTHAEGKTSTGWQSPVRPDKTHPYSQEAQQWDGWGTALKPALEPITVARKPFKGTVANNVLEHGTGAINIDGCRVEGTKGVPSSISTQGPLGWGTGGDMERKQQQNGRWPANLIHDGSDEVAELFPETKSGSLMPGHKRGSSVTFFDRSSKVTEKEYGGDCGSAARFFYCAKASKKDREDGNTHPTVKPTDLMAYLCRLVTPADGVVLDPFMGSGSTGKAAMREGFGFIGIEREAEYFAIAQQRVKQPEPPSREQLAFA